MEKKAIDPIYATRTPRSRPGHRLLATLTLAAAALIISLVLFVAALYANVVPPFHRWIALSPSQTLEVGVVPGCPPAMPDIACLHAASAYPRAFRMVYWSAGEKFMLVSIAISD